MYASMAADVLLQKFKLAIDSSMEGIALLDKEGVYYYLNKVHITTFGYSAAEELLGKTWQYIYEQDEIDRINKSIFPELIREGFWRGETTGKSKDGKPVYQELSLTLMEDGGIVCITKDISDRLKSLQQLQLRNEILEQANSMIIVTNANREILWVNDAFVKISGYSKEEAIGKNPGKILQGAGSDQAAISKLKQAIANKLPFDIELLNYTKKGKPYWVNLKGKPILNKQGDVEFYFSIQEDITERKLFEEKLRDYNIKLEVAISAANGGLWEWDVKTGDVLYSRSWMKLLGYGETENRGDFSFFSDMLHPEDSVATKDIIFEFLSDPKIGYRSEFRLKHKNGKYIHVLDRGIITEWDSQNNPQKMLGMIVDITDLKNAQQQVVEWEERYRKSLEASGAAIWDWNLKKDTIQVTNSFINLFGLAGLNLQTLSFKILAPLVHPEDLPVMKKAIIAHFKGETQKLEVEYRQKRMDTGQYEWFYFIGSVIEWDEEREPLRALGYSHSIERRKQAELLLSESNQKLKLLVDASGVALWEWDIMNDKINAGNDFANLFGFEKIEELPSAFSSLIELIHPEDIPLLQKEINKHFEGKSSLMDLEYRVRMKNENEYRWFNAKGRVITRNSNNQPITAAGLIHGIQERKEAELALAKAKMLAETALKAKRRFLANMSHELRTPLHAINGLGKHLLETKLDYKQRHYLSMMSESSDGLLAIINDLLDYSKIEEGKLNIQKVVYNPSTVIYSVFNLFESQAFAKSISLNIESISPELNSDFIGDPIRIRQVLINIIGNAVKFTEKGSVSVKFTLSKRNTGLWLEFLCCDTGIGMNEEMKNKLFQDFAQEDDSFQRKYGGSGLGLSITKELVMLMKGEIDVNSKKGVGTNILISIPLQASPDKDLGIKSQASPEEDRFQWLKTKEILAVEDNNFNRLLLQIIFEKHHIHCDYANNGIEALNLLKEKKYSIILMDIQMPEMDGIEATNVIRKQLNITIPIIAMTANAVKEELDSYLQLGMDGYLIKPFDEKQLLETLCLQLKQTQ